MEGHVFEEGHAAGVADLVAEVSAERGAVVAKRIRRNQLACCAAKTMIMMSVMPGTGRGTNDESTVDTNESEETELKEEMKQGVIGAG